MRKQRESLFSASLKSTALHAKFGTIFKPTIIGGLLLMTTFYGCRKDITSQDSGAPTKARSAGDGQNDLLGYGYDVTGEYANSASATYSVFNAEALKRDYPTRVEWDLSTKQEGKLIAGENVKSYLEKKSLNISGSVGVGLFKASVSTSFAGSESFYSRYAYCSYDLTIQQKRVKTNADVDLLKQYLQPTFLYDVEHSSPQLLVQKYGTHVLTDIILGAKLELLYRSETTSSNRTTAVSAGITAGVGKIFNINTGFSYSDSSAQSNSSQELHYVTHGGDPSKGLIGTVQVGANNPVINIQNWQGSSTVQNAQLINFGPNGLVPLYEFISDPNKKEAVRNYIIQYLSSNGVVMITELYISTVYENMHYTSAGYVGDVYVRAFYRDKKTPQVVPADLTVNMATEVFTAVGRPYDYYMNLPALENSDHKATRVIPAGQTTGVVQKDWNLGAYVGGNYYKWAWTATIKGPGYEPFNISAPWLF
ncbi:MAC/perforin domain-containing protein [Chitinophaga varians]|uniref:MAC/perforin domain-containing protein n=1 Tax=Chitinophaga varians TaxID=2202339 RepID=UPI00165F6DAD|nr:MAC/perforin domain-containing protein [Chitinophaga varians]MBC9913051.1 hypothetical protein [Chitinophaga varians]